MVRKLDGSPFALSAASARARLPEMLTLRTRMVTSLNESPTTVSRIVSQRSPLILARRCGVEEPGDGARHLLRLGRRIFEERRIGDRQDRQDDPDDQDHCGDPAACYL